MKADTSRTGRLLIAAVLLLSLAVPLATQTRAQRAAAPASDQTTLEQSVRPGINSSYLDPRVDVDTWVQRFEIESREVFAARLDVLKAIGLRPGEHIADIGAGTGFYTELFAETTGATGHVYAVDIAPNFLKAINARSEARGLANVTSVLGRENAVTLPANSLDKAFTCDTYHHFEYPKTMLASIFRALKPGGELVVVDFEREPGRSSGWIMGHVRAGKEVVMQEINAAGFRFVEEIAIPGFRDNYYLRFRKQ